MAARRRLRCYGAIAWMLTAGMATSGCGPCYDALEVTGESTPPVPVVLSPTFEVPRGVAVLISVEPVSKPDRPDYDEYTRVFLVSRDPAVFRVDPTSDSRQYLLMGIAEGETCVDVQIDGFSEECIPAVVTMPQ